MIIKSTPHTRKHRRKYFNTRLLIQIDDFISTMIDWRAKVLIEHTRRQYNIYNIIILFINTSSVFHSATSNMRPAKLQVLIFLSFFASSKVSFSSLFFFFHQQMKPCRLCDVEGLQQKDTLRWKAICAKCKLVFPVKLKFKDIFNFPSSLHF